MMTKLYFARTEALEDPGRFARLLAGLSGARREKAERVRGEGAKRLSLGAGLLLERALAAEGLSAGDYALTELGKPYIPSLPGFHFSLSHSGSAVLCAVSDRPLGCDLERPRRFDPALVRRFFHPEEAEYLFSLPEQARPEAFFRFWTLKESYMKARGLGFALPMNEFAVSPGDEISVSPADAVPWHFLSFREGEYLCALCAEDADDGVALTRVDFADGEV